MLHSHLIDCRLVPDIVLKSWDTERSHIKNSVQYLHQTDIELLFSKVKEKGRDNAMILPHQP